MLSNNNWVEIFIKMSNNFYYTEKEPIQFSFLICQNSNFYLLVMKISQSVLYGNNHNKTPKKDLRTTYNNITRKNSTQPLLTCANQSNEYSLVIYS